MAEDSICTNIIDCFDVEIVKIIEQQKKENQTKWNYAGLISLTVYLSVFLFIGLPVWYRTTTPERWSLPDVSALMVKSQTLTHNYKISVSIPEQIESIDVEQLRLLLQSNYPRRISFDNSLMFNHDWSVRYAHTNEQTLLDDVGNLNELDEKLSKEISTSSILFLILPPSYKTSQLITPGKYRTFFIDLSYVNTNEDIYEILSSSISLQMEQVEAIVERFYSHQAGDNEQNIMLLMARKFDFLFDIIYEDDENNELTDDTLDYLMKRKQRHQNLIDNIDQLVEQFYTAEYGFSDYFQINFITQVLHYVFPNKNFINSKLIKNSNGERFLPVNAVQDILNQVESKRVEHDSEKSYHLLLYVTSSKSGAMKFFEKERNSTSNLILTPFRGAILILNNKTDDLFQGFRQLVRSFFRLQKSTDDVFFTQYEIESIIHALVQKHILQTLQSLESIEKLLKKVSNMVIEKKIAERMQKSLDHSMHAAQLLSETGAISQTYENSWTAYHLSEQAFYDPSLLSLLYFPDGQKYAIYLPLFLPICLPIVTNLLFYVKLFWKKQKEQKLKSE